MAKCPFKLKYEIASGCLCECWYGNVNEMHNMVFSRTAIITYYNILLIKWQFTVSPIEYCMCFGSEKETKLNRNDFDQIRKEIRMNKRTQKIHGKQEEEREKKDEEKKKIE